MVRLTQEKSVLVKEKEAAENSRTDKSEKPEKNISKENGVTLKRVK